MPHLPPGETPFTPHDGSIWSRPRADLRDPRVIVDRMIKDLRAEEARQNFVDLFALICAGWTEEQVEAHGLDAIAALNKGAAR